MPFRNLRARWNCFSPVILFIAFLLALLPAHATAQDLSKRLILKDGSYQMVTKYELKGDRVRYLSAERNEWEELPSSLVDWPATEKYEKDRATSAIPEAVALDKETDVERAAAQSHLPEVAPGLRLPEGSGVFLLDNFKGEPQLVELQQSEGDVEHKARPSIFRGVTGGKQNVELEGEHATVHSHVTVPVIYINVEDADQPRAPGETASPNLSQPSLDARRTQPQGAQQPQQPQQAEGPVVPFDRYRIVRAKVKSGTRVLDLKRNAAGKVSPNEDFIKTTIDRAGSGWFKLTPVAALVPGEYVLVEMGAEGMNLYVWDFNVDQNAPANANPWKPEKEN